MHDCLGVGAGPVGDHPGADQELAGLLQSIVVTLVLGAAVFLAALLAQRVEHRGDGGGAFGGQVTADHAGSAERGAEPHEAVVEAVFVVFVRPLLAPLLDGQPGDRRQVILVGAASDRLQEDLVGLLAHRLRELPRPFFDGGGPGLGDVAGGEGGTQQRPLCEAAHVPDLGPGVLPRYPRFRGEPGRGRSVPVGVMGVSGVEPAQELHVRCGQLRLDLPQRDQRLAARRPVKTGRLRSVQVVRCRAGHAQRFGNALRRARRVTGVYAHPESPLPGAVLCPDVPPQSTQLPLAVSPHLREYV